MRPLSANGIWHLASGIWQLIGLLAFVYANLRAIAQPELAGTARRRADAVAVIRTTALSGKP